MYNNDSLNYYYSHNFEVMDKEEIQEIPRMEIENFYVVVK